MNTDSPQEIEGKWLIRDLGGVRNRLFELGANPVQPREKEINLRFDDKAGSLRAAYQVLRLRKDHAARLTFKGPADLSSGISRRTEIEFAVGDFSAAKAFLEALGYSVCFIYEKYREVFRFSNCLVMLDELPYGDFLEVEGNDAAAIRAVVDQLSLDWKTSAGLSYSGLFDVYNAQVGNELHHLTFEEFSQRVVTPDALGLHYADGGA